MRKYVSACQHSPMGVMKDPDTAAFIQTAVDGWLEYVRCTTAGLDEIIPVDERLAHAIGDRDLPGWLIDALRIRLVADRGEALARRARRLTRH
jgi:hypothetical protein